MNNKLIIIKENKAILESRMVERILIIESKLKELKELQDNYKDQIKNAMEQQEIIKISDEESKLTISYISAQDNLEKFDKDKFQKENPDLYDKYVAMNGKKSAYITIRTK